MPRRCVALVLAACAALCGSHSLAQQGLTAEELAETFPTERIYGGVRIRRDQCAARKLAVWVEQRLLYPYNVTDFVLMVPKAPGRRIFVIGDPGDTN
jgi:hypothetical protein